jgi:hypothetical protein
MASPPDAGTAAEGQPGDRLAAPGFPVAAAFERESIRAALARAFDASPWREGRIDAVMLDVAGPLLLENQGLLERAESAEGKLADAQNAIGQAIREVESWAMTGNPLDPSEVQRVLLGIIFRQWLGGLQLPEAPVQPAGELEAIGTGPLLDPDCRAGKCSSCVGAPCEHECHKRQEAGRGR